MNHGLGRIRSHRVGSKEERCPGRVEDFNSQIKRYGENIGVTIAIVLTNDFNDRTVLRHGLICLSDAS
jgi:hypothetical protein